jgi:threonine dehydrogenase-like Zn-dependent dehydrogenase
LGAAREGGRWTPPHQTGKEAAMKAVTWHGKRDVRVENVPDPMLQEPEDAIIKVTSTGICGSDLHLYEMMDQFMTEGDILGHEAMGEVLEVGPGVNTLKTGDRVVIPFQIACGHCFMCLEGLPTQCETTQVHEYGMGAALFGYTRLYGQVPGGQAELLRVPYAEFGPIKVPDGPPDDRFVYLSDVLPTAWQAVEYAAIPPGGSVAVFGLGPIGDMSTRIAMQRGAERVIGIDLVPERLERARGNGVETVEFKEHEDVVATIQEMTAGRGPDSVIDAVGMEGHGTPRTTLAEKLGTGLPGDLLNKLQEKAGVDRMAALYMALDTVRRGGTVSVIGVYAGLADPVPFLQMFDKQIELRMGQANVRTWVDEIMPLLTDEDPLGVDHFATHRLGLDQAPKAYKDFQQKKDGTVKVLLKPQHKPNP